MSRLVLFIIPFPTSLMKKYIH